MLQYRSLEDAFKNQNRDVANVYYEIMNVIVWLMEQLCSLEEYTGSTSV